MAQLKNIDEALQWLIDQSRKDYKQFVAKKLSRKEAWMRQRLANTVARAIVIAKGENKKGMTIKKAKVTIKPEK